MVGATKFHHVDGAAKAVELELTEEEIAYLEAPYVPHPLAGVMAQNKPENAKGKRMICRKSESRGVIQPFSLIPAHSILYPHP